MRVRTAANVVAIAVVVLIFGAVPGGAAEIKGAPSQNLRLSVTPKSGPAGTLLAIKSVDPCPALGGLPSQFADISIAYSTTSDVIPVEVVHAAVADDGSWSAKVPMPANQTGQAHISADCSRPGVQDRAWYREVIFDITTHGAGFWLLSTMPFPAACFCRTTTNVLATGDARDYGPRPALTGPPLVGIAPNPTTGTGYWLAQADGGVFSTGSARFFGSAASLRLTRPVVGVAATPSGRGYWLVASDGGVFGFGDARFFGSAAGAGSVTSVVGMAATASGRGYWLAMSSGAVFAFGDAPAQAVCVEGCAPIGIVAIAGTPLTTARA